MSRDEQFAATLKSIMETQVPMEEIPSHVIDYLTAEGFVEEHGNRKFHVKESGALLYAEIFIRLRNQGKNE